MSLTIAQWSGDPANPKEVSLIYGGYGIKCITDCNGGTIISNLVFDQATNKNSIYMQRIDAYGKEIWAKDGVQLSDSGHVFNFSVASDAHGGAFYIWSDYRKTSWLDSRMALYVQHIDSYGNSDWKTGGIPLTDFITLGNFVIDYSPSTGLIVFWSNNGIYGQRIDEHGNLLWSGAAHKVSDKASIRTLLITKSNTFLIASYTSLINVSLQGSVIWSHALEYDDQHLLSEYDNEYYVTTSKNDLLIQKYDMKGNPLFGNGKVIKGPFVYTNYKIDPVGNLFILYSHDGMNMFPRYLQKIDKDGNIKWQNELTVSVVPTNQETFILDESGEPIIISEYPSNNNTDYNIYFDRYDSNGNQSKHIHTTLVQKNNRSASGNIIKSNYNSFIYCWVRFTSTWKIYIAKVNAYGVLENTDNYFDYDSYLLEASQKYKIPYNILKAIAKTESNIQQGIPNMNGDGGCGVMQLTKDTKTKAASLLGVSRNELCENTPASARLNILGGAAVLKDCMCWANPRVISKEDFNSCHQNKTGYTFTNFEIDALYNALEVWWWPICNYNGGGKDEYISTSNYPYRVWDKLKQMINDISYPPLSEIQYLCKGDLVPNDQSKSVDYDDHEISSSDDLLYPRPEMLGKTPSSCIRWTNGKFNPFSDIIIHTNEGSVYTDIASIENMPSCFSLGQNYPNPFNPTTTIKFSVPSVETFHGTSLQHVALKVYDLLGREVSTLVNEEKAPGIYEVKFDGINLPSGVYFYRLQAGSYSQTKKLILMK
jgi:hypothetical protein